MTSFATREHSVRPDTGLPPRRSRDRERVPSSRQLATFGLLPEPEGRNKSFIVSLIVNASAIALVLILSIFMVHTGRTKTRDRDRPPASHYPCETGAADDSREASDRSSNSGLAEPDCAKNHVPPERRMNLSRSLHESI